MNSPSIGRPHLPSADGAHTVEPKGRSMDDSLDPVWVIANKIAIYFLAMSAVAFLALMTDAFLTRS